MFIFFSIRATKKNENYWSQTNIEVDKSRLTFLTQIFFLQSESEEETPYLFLSVDLPPPPLFRDQFKESIIPQVPLFQILTKFDGQTPQDYKTYKDNYLKRYEIRKLPPYLILCFRVRTRMKTKKFTFSFV